MGKEKIIELIEKYVSDTISEDEMAELSELASKDKLLDKAIYDSLSSSEVVAGAEEAKQRLFESISKHLEETPQKRRTSRFDLWLRVAAILAIVVSLGLMLKSNLHNNKPTEQNDLWVEVLKGQKCNLILPDGTKVNINSDSKLSFGRNFNEKERVVELSGEAYFEVEPDHSRPFVVVANNISVTALGTEFSVRNYGNQPCVDVFLAEGSVSVTDEQKQIVMTPLQLLNFDKRSGKTTVVDNVNTKKYLCWMDGMLYINNQTFEQVAQILERTYNIEIRFMNNDLKRHRFTGWVSNNSLESTLHILKLTTEFSYSYENNALILR